MTFRIGKRFHVECGHMLSKHSGGCRFPHGHSLAIEVVMESDELDRNDMVCDLKLLREEIRDFIQHLDHAFCINSRDPGFSELKKRYGDKVIGFSDKDPTMEVLAKTIYDRIDSHLARSTDISPGICVVCVRVSETSTSWAEYVRD